MSLDVPSTAIEAAIYAYVAAAAGGAIPVIWERDGGPREPVSYISLDVTGSDPLGQPWLKKSANPLTFVDKAVTGASAAANILTVVAHGLATGDGPVRLTNTGGALPGGLAAGTDYWARAVDADTLSLATTLARANAGTVVDLADAGSGTTKVVATADTVTLGAELVHTANLPVRSELTITCYAAAPTGPDGAHAVVARVVASAALPARRAALRAAGIGLVFGPIVTAGSVLNRAVFEPRAMVTAHFFPTVQVSETGLRLDAVEVEAVVTTKDGEDLADVTITIPADPGP